MIGTRVRGRPYKFHEETPKEIFSPLVSVKPLQRFRANYGTLENRDSGLKFNCIIHGTAEEYSDLLLFCKFTGDIREDRKQLYRNMR
jgi:hypothetical protein